MVREKILVVIRCMIVRFEYDILELFQVYRRGMCRYNIVEEVCGC